MREQVQKFQEVLNKSNKVLLIFPQMINSDVCASLGLMYKALKVSKKDVDVVSPRRIPARFNNLLNSCGIAPENILLEIKPISYIINVDKGNKEDLDIDWERIDDKLQIVLTTQTADIDFKKFSFAKTGGIYDLAITFNADKLEDLGSLYENHKEAFERFDVVAFTSKSNSPKFADVSIADTSYTTTSEILYKVLPELNYQLNNADANLVAEGILGSTYGLHRVNKKNTFKTISELVAKYKIDTAEINTKYFYSLSKETLRLKERLIRNVRYDDAKSVIYSTLSNLDFRELGVTEEMLDGVDYLPFNVIEEYDMAFLAYESGNEICVLLHSNDKDADVKEVVSRFNGYTSGAFGMIVLNTDLNSAINSVLSNIRNVESGTWNVENGNNLPATNYQPRSSKEVAEPESLDNLKETKAEEVVREIEVQEEIISEQKEAAEVEAVKPEPELVEVVETDEVSEEAPSNKEQETSEKVGGAWSVESGSNAPTTNHQPSTSPELQATSHEPQAPTPSPFTKANNYLVDENAKPMKVPAQGTYGFNQSNKPFEPSNG